MLRGERVSLALPTKEDLADLCLWNDVESRCYGSKPYAVITTDPEERFKRVMKEWYRENYFSIVENEGERFLGHISLSEFLDVRELRISLLRERDRGFGTEAIKLGLTWAFAIRGTPTVVLFVLAYNRRAIRAYEKAGFRELCVVPKALNVSGEYQDMVFMVAEKEQWLKENREFVLDVLRRSGYPLDALPAIRLIQ